MNCEVCCEKFKRIEDLINHAATGSHQESITKYQNTLRDYPPNTVPPASRTAKAVTDNVFPLSTESAPAVDGSVRIAAESVSVASDKSPIVSNSKASDVNLFSCMACSMDFSNLSDVVQHSESVLHAIMVLATGIGFDEQADISGGSANSSPMLYHCIVCNIHRRDLKLYNEHLKTRFHRKIVRRMSNFFKRITTDPCCNELTSSNSELPEFYCKLCNVKFENTKCLERHLSTKKHRRILPLVKKTVHGENENLGNSFNLEQTENLNGSFYYCALCNISVDFHQCEKHLQWINHKRVQQYVGTMHKYCGLNDNDIDILYDSEEFKKVNKKRKSLYYCELCNVWCLGFNSFERHLKGKKHSRQISQIRIDTDAKSPDSSSLLRHCDVCNVQCVNSKRFKNHLKSKIHIRIGQIISELSESKEEASAELSLDAHGGKVDDSSQLPYYCKLCDVLCSCPKTYDSHLKGKTHNKIKKIVSALTSN